MLNKIQFEIEPMFYPDTDKGNLRLFYELELLKSYYETTECSTCFERYLKIIDTLVDREQSVDFSTELKIDKAVRVVKVDSTVIDEPVSEKMQGDIHIHLDSSIETSQTKHTENEAVDLEYKKTKLELLKAIANRVNPREG